jgi:rhomboid protease GluP
MFGRVTVPRHEIATSPMGETDTPINAEWDGLVEVGRYPTLAEAHEHGLVILAMRQPCWVAEDGTDQGFSLHAEADAAPAISRELGDYDEEQALQPTTARDIETESFRHPAGWGVYGVWAMALILTFLFQGTIPDLADRGASSSIGLIGNREWWRPFTALFLHGDAPHLIGNLLSGMLFGTLLARSIGPLRAWALILACGTLGNTITSIITWPESFTSIGASTAVFGALGILSGLGFSFMLRHRFRLPWARVAAPVLAGIVLLGWFGGGTPGGNTDVLGHVFGFVSGLAAGLVTGSLNPSTAGALIAGNARAERGGLT